MQTFWSGEVDTSRTPSPARRPVKRSKQVQEEEPAPEILLEDGLFDEALFNQLVSDGALGNDHASNASWSAMANSGYWSEPAADGNPSALGYPAAAKESLRNLFSRTGSQETLAPKAKMQTGCIPCL